MAKFDLDSYETVAERTIRAREMYPDLRIINTPLDMVRDEFNRPIQYVMMSQIYVGEILMAQDVAEEIVGNGPVNKTSALENASTSATGRALANMGFMGADPRKTRPSREEMEKVERMQKPTQSPEQEALAMTAIEQINDIQTIDELRNFYTGAQEAGILHVNINGLSVNGLIGARKKALEAK
jgi:hypothetical protein